MNPYDLIGLAVLLLIILGALYGLHRITRPVNYTKEVYERRLKKGTGIARGVMNAGMYPFEELLNPKAVEAVHVKKDMKAGYYDTRQEDGEGIDDPGSAPPPEGQEVYEPGNRRTRPPFLQRLFKVLRFRR